MSRNGLQALRENSSRNAERAPGCALARIRATIGLPGVQGRTVRHWVSFESGQRGMSARISDFHSIQFEVPRKVGGASGGMVSSRLYSQVLPFGRFSFARSICVSSWTKRVCVDLLVRLPLTAISVAHKCTMTAFTCRSSCGSHLKWTGRVKNARTEAFFLRPYFATL